LIEKGIDFETINYLEERLSFGQLKDLLHRAGLTPRDALRSNEDSYRQHVAGKNLSDDQLLAIMVKHPELVQRPIVVRQDKAVLARQADRLAELLGWLPAAKKHAKSQ